MLRVNLPLYGRSWDLPKDKVLRVIPESIIGQAIETEPDLTVLDLSNPDVKPEAMDVIADYLNGQEPAHHIPGLESSAKYLNALWLLYYTDPMYDQIIANPFFLDMYLENAARDGNIHMVNYLLQKGVSPVKTITPQFRPTFAESVPPPGFSDKPYSISQPFRSAVDAGHLNIVKLLLSDPRVAAVADLQEALSTAVHNGQLDMARYLLGLISVDPKVLNEHLIPMAVEGGDMNMLKLLLVQGPIPYEENKGLEAAISMDHQDIIDLYLQDPGFEPHLHYYLSKAAEFSDPETVKKFLAADPSLFDNDILKDAIRHDRPELVALLLADPRVNPETIQDRDETLYEFIHENPEAETVKLTRADGRLPEVYFTEREINYIR